MNLAVSWRVSVCAESSGIRRRTQSGHASLPSIVYVIVFVVVVSFALLAAFLRVAATCCRVDRCELHGGQLLFLRKGSGLEHGLCPVHLLVELLSV
jgi:hypothetical protein